MLLGLITDFGTRDYFAGTLKGVIKKNCPEADIIDICHDVKPYSLVQAQYVLHATRDHFPVGTVFVIVIDPGVGSRRRALAARDTLYSYVLPDNGILSSVAGPDLRVFAIEEKQFSEVSSTFHGRDIFAPAAAWIAGGKPLEELGCPVEDYVRREFPVYEVRDDEMQGFVIHIDTFGNLITSLPNSLMWDDVSGTCILDGGRVILPLTLCRTYCDLRDDQIGLMRGSSGFLELSLNQTSLAGRYQIQIEDKLVIRHEG